MKHALQEPLRQLVTNAGLEGSSALENAASVAGMILSTEALVSDLADGQAVAAGSGALGMYD